MKSWCTEPGAYVLVDGQFGSTGKGLLAAYLAGIGAGKITHVTTNAGPNSGHTAYYDTDNGKEGEERYSTSERIMTQQIPVAAVVMNMMGSIFQTILNAGAVIDPEILDAEVKRYGVGVFVHPNAALIDPAMVGLDKNTTAIIAGTGKGVGPAQARKLMRFDGKRSIASHVYLPDLPPNWESWDALWNWSKDVVFVETAQGFSLGINSARFYPHVTSRECTVMQAIADARIPAQMVKKVVATFRTYPIRVGNTATGNSGDWYPDQQETTWESIGQTPELTTVTKRVRRVATWSRIQFRECLAANRPDALFLNFCNYMSRQQLIDFVQMMIIDYTDVMGRDPEDFLMGFGPRCSDILTLEEWMHG